MKSRYIALILLCSTGYADAQITNETASQLTGTWYASEDHLDTWEATLIGLNTGRELKSKDGCQQKIKIAARITLSPTKSISGVIATGRYTTVFTQDGASFQKPSIKPSWNVICSPNPHDYISEPVAKGEVAIKLSNGSIYMTLINDDDNETEEHTLEFISPTIIKRISGRDRSERIYRKQ